MSDIFSLMLSIPLILLLCWIIGSAIISWSNCNSYPKRLRGAIIKVAIGFVVLLLTWISIKCSAY